MLHVSLTIDILMIVTADTGNIKFEIDFLRKVEDILHVCVQGWEKGWVYDPCELREIQC